MEPISYLEQRVAEMQAQLRVIKQKIDEATTEQTVAEADLEGFQRALEAERRLRGIAPKDQPPQIISTSPMAAGADNKAEFARQFIRNKPNGVTPRANIRCLCGGWN